MAKRRALTRGLAGAGAGLAEGAGNLGSFMMRQALADDAQKAIDERSAKTQAAIAERQGINQTQGTAQEILKEFMKNPGDPQAFVAALKMLGVDADPKMAETISPPRRRVSAKLSPLVDSMNGAEDLPPEQIAAIGRSEGDVLPPEWSAGMMEAENDPLQNMGDTTRNFGQAAEVKRRSLSAKPTEKVTGTDATGASFTQMLTPAQLADPFRTSPSSAEQGVLAGQQEAGKQKTLLGDDALTALTAQTQGRIANIVDNMTRAGKAATAGAVAGATERAKLAPDIVKAEVDKALQISSGKDNASQGERTAATNFVPLVNANARLLQHEANGVRVSTGAQTATQYGLLNQLVPEDQQKYIQAGRDFVSTLGQIRSGVAVPEPEVNRFVSTFLGISGDSPTVLKQKQTAREVFIGALQTGVGRSGEEAGKNLAEAINAGQIPASVLPSLQFSNPALEKALLANLKGVPQFDLNGHPIGVRK